MTDSSGDSGSESDPCPVIAKKAKFAGAAKYKTRFKPEWVKRWPFLTLVRADKSRYHCNICNKTLSCGHQGETDVKRHISSESHTALTKAQTRQPAINSMFSSPSSNLTEKVSSCKLNWRLFLCVIIINIFGACREPLMVIPCLRTVFCFVLFFFLGGGGRRMICRHFLAKLQEQKHFFVLFHFTLSSIPLSLPMPDL